jgi:hypothetical protein
MNAKAILVRAVRRAAPEQARAPLGGRTPYSAAGALS